MDEFKNIVTVNLNRKRKGVITKEALTLLIR